VVMAGIFVGPGSPADTVNNPHGAPPRTRSAPFFRCGHCLAVIPEAALDPSLRCPACHKRNALPRGVRASCERCKHRQHVRIRQLTSEPRCAACGQVLSIEDVILTPLHRRRRSHESGHAGRYRRREGGRGQGVLTLLIVGVGALLALKLIVQQ